MAKERVSKTMINKTITRLIPLHIRNSDDRRTILSILADNGYKVQTIEGGSVYSGSSLKEKIVVLEIEEEINKA